MEARIFHLPDKKLKINVFQYITVLLSRIRIFFLFQFRLKPRIQSLRIKIDKLIVEKSHRFSIGKSILEFPGEDNVIFFVIYKEPHSIRVLEIYDKWIRKLPEKYSLLEKVLINNLI